MSPTISLNHFYLALDPVAYRAIRECRFLWDEFALGEERTTLANSGDAWTGAYFYGQQTYFEFLDAAALRLPSLGLSTSQLADPAGAFGLALATETPGSTAQLQQHELAEGTTSGLRTRHWAGADLPWFYSTPMQIFRPGQPISTWLMEYHPDFLVDWHPELAPTEADISRAAVLGKYKRVLWPKGDLPGRLLQDVTHLRLRLDPVATAAVTNQLAAFGCPTQPLVVAASPANRWVEWRSEGFLLQIEVVSNWAGPVLQAVGFSLAHSLAHSRVVDLPNSVLVVGPGPTAQWQFGGQ